MAAAGSLNLTKLLALTKQAMGGRNAGLMDDAWYTGVVTSWDGKAMKHKVLYDDGVSEELNLAEENVRIFASAEEEEAGKLI